MNEVNEIHRDIYVGMVAEEMAQSGYYGEDVTVYGFMDKEDGFLHAFADEAECAKRYLQLLAQGRTLSRMGSVHKRVLLEQRASAILELDEKLWGQVKNHWIAIDRRSVSIEPVKEYVQSLSTVELQLKKAAIAGIATMPMFLFSEDDYAFLTSLLEQTNASQGKRRHFGFMLYQGEDWEMVLNGSLPAILEKWLAYAEEKRVTPILRMHIDSGQPIYALKSEFEVCLKQTMDKGYLELLNLLYEA